jgi:hypothetical protein
MSAQHKRCRQAPRIFIARSFSPARVNHHHRPNAVCVAKNSCISDTAPLDLAILADEITQGAGI